MLVVHQGVHSLLDLTRERIKHVMLLFLREGSKNVIKKGRGGADELAGVSFHGQILTMLPHGVGHLWG